MTPDQQIQLDSVIRSSGALAIMKLVRSFGVDHDDAKDIVFEELDIYFEEEFLKDNEDNPSDDPDDWN